MSFFFVQGTDGRRPWLQRSVSLALAVGLVAGPLATGCDHDKEPAAAAEGASRAPASNRRSKSSGAKATKASARRTAREELPDDLPQVLLVAYAQFEVEAGNVTAKPGPARLEILARRGGKWQVEAFEDPDSNVFHKAMAWGSDATDKAAGILTLGGTAAAIKLWRRPRGVWEAQTLWEQDFGGKKNRMRDGELADLDGDDRAELVVGTHDQGVVAVLSAPASAAGKWAVNQLDGRPNTWIHEIEIGDLDGDKSPEIYATPSEPNTLEGGTQHGEVVRYRRGKAKSEGSEPEWARKVVADLGQRHAKEIYVGDVDGDGTDELYVAVEALTEGTGGASIVEPVEIRRYDRGTPPKRGPVVGTIRDRFTRFVTVGDFDGDGSREMIAAAFSTGLWRLKPGRNPRAEWSIESIDRDSGGFEHAALAADLDEDGVDELYVAADDQGEIRRYVWQNGRARREVIHKRRHPRARLTWNLTTAPQSLVGTAP